MKSTAALHSFLPIACVSLALAAAAQAALIVQYEFEETSGVIAADTAGTAQNATITGGSFVNDSERGRVLNMTGTGANAAYGSVAITSTTGSYTFAAWYKGSDVTGYLYDQTGSRLIPSLGSSTQSDPNDGGLTSIGQGGLGSFTGASWTNSGADNTTWTTGEWVHLAWVFENNGLGAGTDSVTIYLNGAAQDVNLGAAGLQTQRAIENIPSLGGTQKLFARAASSDDTNQLTGLIDDYRIYDHALTASEIVAIPEPGAALLGSLGLLALLRRRRN